MPTQIYIILSFILGSIFGWKVCEYCIGVGLASLLHRGDGVQFDEQKQQLIIDVEKIEALGFRRDEDYS
jgi:hypothetical protein